MPRHKHIDGLQAARLAHEAAQREPVRILPSAPGEDKQIDGAGSEANQVAKKAPPRLKKPSRQSEVVVGATAKLEEHKAALRYVFGETLSDEFVDVMLMKIVSALCPGPHDVLQEATLNAAIALIASMEPRSELEAVVAVQIAATAFGGLKFLELSQRHLDENLHRRQSEGALGQIFERTNTAIDRVGLVAPITYGDLTYRQFAVVCGLT